MKGIITKLICCIAVCFCFFTIIVTFDGEPAGVNVLAEDGKQNSDEIDISDLWDVQPWVEVTVEEYTNRVIIKTYAARCSQGRKGSKAFRRNLSQNSDRTDLQLESY